MKPGDQMSSEGDAQNGLSATAKGLLARAGVTLPKAEDDRGSIDGQADLPKEMLVDVGGAKRTVRVEELVAAFTDQEKSKKVLESAEARLEELGDLNSIRSLKQTIDGLDASRRAKVLALLSGEDDEAELDREIRSAVDDDAPAHSRTNGRRAEAPDEMTARFSRLEQAVMGLAQRENGRIATERTQSLSEKIEAEMQQFPVFNGNEHAAAFARDSIMTMLTHDEGADVGKVVRGAAAKLQGMLDQRRQELNEELGVPRTMVQPADPKRLNAGALKSGGIRRMAEQAINRLQGGKRG